MTERKKRVTLGSPVLAFDFPWQEGEEYKACHHCLPWSVEFFFDPQTDEPWVREWHAVDCALWDQLAEDDD